MSVLIFAETHEGTFKKAAFEAVTYGSKLAKSLNVSCSALVLGSCENPEVLGNYGAQKVLHADSDQYNKLDSQVYTNAIADAFAKAGGSVLILSHSSTGKSIAGRLSVRLKAGLISGANAIPTIEGSDLIVSKTVFSGKAVANVRLSTSAKVISLMGNAIKPEQIGSTAETEKVTLEAGSPNISVKEVKTVKGEIPLPEAEIVVSAGRGMKDPSNWEIVEELAHELGATTACSRPVADAGWRPHHEHVGQTGIAIRPNLYFAIGISGAIQHLAGVNNSKVIVVINKDPEAPFFKAADYGVVGDLFDVVPKLTTAYKNFKVSNG